VAYGGQAALKIAAETPPDVALVDLSMPGMDGYALARELRNRCSKKRPLLVAITGCAFAEDDQSHEAGFDLHLTKPADAGQLLALLARFHGIVQTHDEVPTRTLHAELRR